MESLLQGIEWLGHASFRITGEKTVYIDPWQIEGGPLADIILVTHDHRDHLSPEDIAKISTPRTVFVCPQFCASKLQGQVRGVKPGDKIEIEGVHIEAVPAYNTNKPNHPRKAGHVGYIVEMGGRRIYHAGDTDLIPEMSQFKCDVALLPIGGTYTMNADEAADAVLRIRPKVVIPMHWGRIVGGETDVERFRKLVPEDVQVVVLKVTR